MAKHAAGPFTVRVIAYRIAPHVDTRDHVQVWQSRHASPHAASRKLASVIAGRTALAKQIRACIPRDFAGKYLIESGDGVQYALIPFRAQFCS